MSLWEALALGIVQGLTEFLPVSSSGHLVVGQALLGIELPGVGFEVVAHFATLVSVLIAYRGRVGALVLGSIRLDAAVWRYLGVVGLANLPAAAVFFLLGDVVEAAFETPAAAGVAFLVTGGVLWSARAATRRGEREAASATGAPQPRADSRQGGGPTRGARGDAPRDEQLDLLDPPLDAPAPSLRVPGPGVALLIGCAQALALLPGISRSGSTVVTALWLGVDSEDAAEFSFLMSVPAILGAVLVKLVDAGAGASAIGSAPLAVGAVAAAATGLLAIRMFLAVLRAHAFDRFAPYPWLLGLLFLAYLWTA